MLVALLLLALLGAGSPGPASARGADAQGWWWTASQEGLPAVPAPPDMTAGDLLLQGGDALRLAGQPAAPTALAALRFHLTEGARVAGLALGVGTGARADDVRAYATSAVWLPADGGPLAQAPAPDVSRYSAGRLSEDGALLSFPDIDRLVTEDGTLSVVLVPGPTDRVVVHRPPATALSVVLPVLVVATPPGRVAQPGPALVPPAVVQAPLLPVEPVSAPAPVVPVVAAAPAAAVPVLAAALPTQRVVADDTRTRLVVLAEGVLLLLTFGLLGQGPLAAAARLVGPVAVDTGERGVGRFRVVREGPAPRL